MTFERLPLWLQKSWGQWTVYAGAGRWLNPGTGNRDSSFSGIAVLREVSPKVTLGGEVYGSTAATTNGSGSTAFNVGALVTHDEHHGFVVSIGRSLGGPTAFSAYAALELLLGPTEKQATP